MATLNVKVPDEMETEIEAYLAEHPYYLNKSELVRDAIRHLIAVPPLSSEVLAKVAEGRAQVARGDELPSLDEV